MAGRLSGQPLQYMTGAQKFRKIELAVGPGVLVPRPETELLVEVCLPLVAGVRRGGRRRHRLGCDRNVARLRTAGRSGVGH